MVHPPLCAHGMRRTPQPNSQPDSLKSAAGVRAAGQARAFVAQLQAFVARLFEAT
eukprot:CAMPEP_0195592548 /NCGR_PEP_ID=MMETSP0815-20121206/409_1 /TAXON_ID=97485 /ORGANISM="Prymnesium parvum, Strain Texoma1" /LENGTH=54 /DNA_ID=CAMNT_0040731627 /DNA_START=194 /DNA_END=355 /DNA_ORIENTATION=+